MGHKVVFQPSGRRGEVDEDKTILEAARELGDDIESVCGGKRTCGKCKVIVEEGFFQRHGVESRMAHLSQIGLDEKKFIGDDELEDNVRLSCQAVIQGDVVVFVPEKSRRSKQIVGKAATERAIKVEPAVQKYYVELPVASLEDMRGDADRLLKQLSESYNLRHLQLDYHVLKELPDALRESEWRVTAALWMDREVISIEPGYAEDVFGMAVDIGTTTVVAHLTDLRTGRIVATESAMNPQVAYGEDVLSRTTFAAQEKDGLQKMHTAIIKELNQMAERATKQVGLTPQDVLEMVVVGNTIMHHLFLNINPRHIGVSPFAPAVQRAMNVKARELGLRVNPGAYVHVLPNEMGFIGADNVSVLIAEEPFNQDEVVLIIDIGTNCELVLGNRHRLISTSCATGPALEGAHIRFGMRAGPGAIERVKIDPETLEVKFKVIGKTEWHTEYPPEAIGARGICGSGIIDAVAEMFKCGIILKTGNFNSKITSPRLTRDAEGLPQFVLAWARETALGVDITVSIKDVRAVQVAKAALYCGAKVLLSQYGVARPDRIILAGAFGSYIDKEQAMVLGLFPDCNLDSVYSVGNAAGDGARIALLNVQKRAEAERVAGSVEYVELATYPTFQREFMEAIHFPHMKDSFPSVRHALPVGHHGNPPL